MSAAVLLALSLMWSPQIAAREIGPESNLCAEINALPAGEELVLAPGDYQWPCAIRRGGELGIPIVIRAAGPTRRPRVIYNGSTTNVFEVQTSHFTIPGLEVVTKPPI